MHLVCDAADAVRELDGVGHDAPRGRVAGSDGPAVLVCTQAVRRSETLGHLAAKTYVDVDVFVSSLGQAQGHELICRREYFVFVDV